jgi:hypothetical protein
MPMAHSKHSIVFQLFRHLVILLLQLLLAVKRLVREGSVLDHERLEGIALARLSYTFRL